MALTTVANGNTAQANDLNQAINVLQQPSGGQEKGEYFFSQGCHASGDFVSIFYPSLSRVSVPVSASIDTAFQSPSNCNAPGTNKLSANGVQVNTTSTGATGNATVGGNLTIQF